MERITREYHYPVIGRIVRTYTRKKSQAEHIRSIIEIRRRNAFESFQQNTPHVAGLILDLCEEFRVNPYDVYAHSKGRWSKARELRNFAYYVMNCCWGMSFAECGRHLHRGPESAKQGIRWVEDRRDETAFDDWLTDLETRYDERKHLIWRPKQGVPPGPSVSDRAVHASEREVLSGA